MHLSEYEAKDFDLIRQLASQALSVPVTDIQRLNGTMAYNYEINHKYIFKLPHSYTEQENWLHQAQLAPVLQRHFNFQIPMPQVKTLRLSDKRTLLTSCYIKIAGKSLNDWEFAAKDRKFKTRFFEQLSDAASQIHSVPLSELPFQLPTKIDYLEKCFFKNEKGDNYYPKKLFRKLMHNSFWGLGECGLRTSLLAHTDLHSGNVLLNDKNELVAILDFDDMVHGDRFMEFRPKLYPDYLDNRLFQKIYQERTGVKVNMHDVYQQEIAQSSLSWFYSLYQLYRLLPTSDRNKKMKQGLKHKIASAEGVSKCI